MDAIVKYPNRWPAGVSGNPNGRPVGHRTRHQFSAAFLADLAEVWTEHGDAAHGQSEPRNILCRLLEIDPEGRAANH
jgi:hypothetical protein